MQLLDSDWPADILAGSHFRAQETRALSPDGVCALARARLGTRLSICRDIVSAFESVAASLGYPHLKEEQRSAIINFVTGNDAY